MSEAEMVRTRRLACMANEVHVWRIALDLDREELSALATVLSRDEYDHSFEFRSETLRCRWIAAHGALRFILAAYTQTAPGTLCFMTEPAGKPKLVPADLSFNLTHTDRFAFVAVATGGLVGIDAEIVRPQLAWEDIGRTFLARKEVSAILRLAPELRTRAFYACWTRKEAYLKALGFGLDVEPDKFQVTVGPDQPFLLHQEDSPKQTAQWGLADLSEADIAVALATHPAKPVTRRFMFSRPLCSIAPDSIALEPMLLKPMPLAPMPLYPMPLDPMPVGEN